MSHFTDLRKYRSSRLLENLEQMRLLGIRRWLREDSRLDAPVLTLSATLVRDKAAEMLKVALPDKGRLADDRRTLFGEAGLPVNSVSERSLSASLGGEFEAIFVRAQDIPEFVADNAADAGITGWDL